MRPAKSEEFSATAGIWLACEREDALSQFARTAIPAPVVLPEPPRDAGIDCPFCSKVTAAILLGMAALSAVFAAVIGWLVFR
jgi:hypothetical protein